MWERTWRGMRLLCVAIICATLASGVVRGQDEGLTLIIELLRDADKDIRALALEQVRTEAKGEAATRKFAELLPTLPPETQVGLLGALAARGDVAAAPEVRKLTTSEVEAVRVAAVDALGYLGNEADVSALVEQLAAESEPLQKAARRSLIRLAGQASSDAIIEQMKSGPVDQRVALIEVLTERRAGEKELLAAAIGDDPRVRAAAVAALDKIAGPEHLSGLVQAVLKAKPGSERVAVERAIAAVCQRSDEPAALSEPLLIAINLLDDRQQQLELMPALGRVGGKEALNTIEEAIRSKNSAEHNAGITALCNWPDGTVVARLLELARTEEHTEHRTQTRRALIRIAPLEDERSDARRLDLLMTLWAMAPDDAERKQILDRAKAVRIVQTLRFVVPFMSESRFAEQACLTVVELAHHSGLREANREEFHQALDKVIATSKNATVVDRARRYKAGQTWVRPKAAS